VSTVVVSTVVVSAVVGVVVSVVVSTCIIHHDLFLVFPSQSAPRLAKKLRMWHGYF
jgi:hypothetical protein